MWQFDKFITSLGVIAATSYFSERVDVSQIQSVRCLVKYSVYSLCTRECVAFVCGPLVCPVAQGQVSQNCLVLVAPPPCILGFLCFE